MKNFNQNLMTFEANSTVLITALEGYPVHPTYEVTLENTNQYDYMHFAFCLKGRKIKGVIKNAYSPLRARFQGQNFLVNRVP